MKFRSNALSAIPLRANSVRKSASNYANRSARRIVSSKIGVVVGVRGKAKGRAGGGECGLSVVSAVASSAWINCAPCVPGRFHKAACFLNPRALARQSLGHAHSCFCIA